ncbi:MAG: Hpt domain-containing protein [Chloroflexi bacterium]|nr:Hpt domain-containing protein [Chloroflexota bacterium]
MPELVHLYVQNGYELLGEMRRALATDDAPTLRRAAHTLKGGSGMYGATNLADICRKLEDSAREGVLAGAAERIAEIGAEFERVRAALEREVGAQDDPIPPTR